MTPQELKTSVLLRAMQGKVTEQLPSDGTAKDILPFLHIDTKLRGVEEPFDIPDSWLWIAIGNLGASTDTDSFSDGPFGSNLKTEHYIQAPEVRIIQLSNIGENGWRNDNVKYTSYRHLEEVIPRCEVHPGDLVIAKMMPAGRTIEVPELGTRITLGSDAMRFVPNPVLNKQFLLYAMASQAFLSQVYAEAHGITRVRTTLKGIKSYVLPIPPLAEQKRIVAKIEELLPLIDRYEEAWTKLEVFNKRFPGDMQKSLLQMAIQGKLVEQRPEEGTGEEVYQQIQAEKQALIKAGKIKKEKPLPEIAEDEKPFDIPESWKWVRFSDIALFENGDRSSKYPVESDYVPFGIPFFGAKDMNETDMSFANVRYISQDKFDSLGNGKLVDGDFICLLRGSVGKTATFKADSRHQTGFICAQMLIIRCISKEIHDYVSMFMKAPIYVSMVELKTTGTAVRQLPAKEIANILIPLPPLAEQKRIVAKLEELLPLCERLK